MHGYKSGDKADRRDTIWILMAPWLDDPTAEVLCSHLVVEPENCPEQGF